MLKRVHKPTSHHVAILATAEQTIFAPDTHGAVRRVKVTILAIDDHKAVRTFFYCVVGRVSLMTVFEARQLRAAASRNK